MKYIALFTLVIVLAATPLYAENSAGPDAKTREARWAELKKLKESDPEAFRKIVEERKARLRERLQELKEKDPKKFEELKQRIVEKRKQKIREWKQNDPARYEQFMKEQSRLRKKIEPDGDR